MGHSPYSSDLASSDVHRFEALTEQLASKRVVTGTDRKQDVTSLLHKINTDFFHAMIQVILPLWDASLRQRLVSTLRSDAYSLILLNQTYMKVRINVATKCLLPSFLEPLCNNNTLREKVINKSKRHNVEIHFNVKQINYIEFYHFNS